MLQSDVRLRPLAPPDMALAAKWLSESSINQWLSSEWRRDRVDAGALAIGIRKSTNRIFVFDSAEVPCGLAALSDLDLVDRTAMVWYLLGRSELAGRGMTTAAVSKLLVWGFQELHLHSMYAWIVDGNVASAALLRKLGFHEAGRLREATSLNGRKVDRVYFDLLGKEFRGVTGESQ